MASCTDNHQFDLMSKALSSDLSRRQALKWVTAGVLGTMMSAVGVRKASAVPCTAGVACEPIGGCKGSATCYCTHKTKNGIARPKTFCWENQFCVDTPTCNNSRFCKDNVGLNYRCVETCCGPGNCFPKCGTATPISTSGGGARGAN